MIVTVFYEKCIPKYQKEHIPVSEDGDEFLCHKCYKVKPSKSSRPSNKNGRKKVITMNKMMMMI
jgi:hypothetical protein